MVRVKPAPAGDSGVIVAHHPLKTLDIRVDELLNLARRGDVLGRVLKLELELLLKRQSPEPCSAQAPLDFDGR